MWTTVCVWGRVLSIGVDLSWRLGGPKLLNARRAERCGVGLCLSASLWGLVGCRSLQRSPSVARSEAPAVILSCILSTLYRCNILEQAGNLHYRGPEMEDEEEEDIYLTQIHEYTTRAGLPENSRRRRRRRYLFDSNTWIYYQSRVARKP